MPYSGYSDRDDDTGQMTERCSDEDILKVLSDEPMATADVADEIGYSRDRAGERLNQLAEDGRIQRIEKSNGFLCFWQL